MLIDILTSVSGAGKKKIVQNGRFCGINDLSRRFLHSFCLSLETSDRKSRWLQRGCGAGGGGRVQ